jgi:DNA adenine methylase
MPSVRSPFAWPGGKRGLTKTLLGRLPEHRVYVEVFAGSAKLLFAKAPSEREVMNDLNGEVTNFFRVAKHRPAELAECFDQEIVHAGRFRELREFTGQEDELHRALRFAYLVWYSYGAKGDHFAGGSAKMVEGRPLRSLDRVRELLAQTATRLRNVLIEQRDFSQVLTRYDSADAFFYLDPPYVHFGNLARYDALSEERRTELFQLLSELKGKFLMSFDDCDEVRDLSRRHKFQVERVEVSYTLANTPGSRGKRGEVLITGPRQRT